MLIDRYPHILKACKHSFYLVNFIAFVFMLLICVSLVPFSFYNKYQLWKVGALSPVLIRRAIADYSFIGGTTFVLGTIHFFSKESIKQILAEMNWVSWLLLPLILYGYKLILEHSYVIYWCSLCKPGIP